MAALIDTSVNESFQGAVERVAEAKGVNMTRLRHRVCMYAQELMRRGDFDVEDFVKWVEDQGMGHVWENGRWP